MWPRIVSSLTCPSHTQIHACIHIYTDADTYTEIHTDIYTERHTNTDTLIHTLLTEPAASWATWPVYRGVRARC